MIWVRWRERGGRDRLAGSARRTRRTRLGDAASLMTAEECEGWRRLWGRR